MAKTIHIVLDDFPKDYPFEVAWNFLPEEVMDGTIEPYDGQTYYFKDGRLYEAYEEDYYA